MPNCKAILGFHPESFCATRYSTTLFRMIGLIDVDIAFSYGTERVTLAFYSSSGTNDGKTKGLWYPIVGIKLTSGPFIEFTPYLNHVLTHTTQNHAAKEGWLAKSLFFHPALDRSTLVPGFSAGIHHEMLLEIGRALQVLYDLGHYYHADFLTPYLLNTILTSPKIYPTNHHPQRENFEKFIQDIFEEKPPVTLP